MPLSDSEIIEQIRKGAKHQFARLVDRYKEKAMTLAVRMLKNREDAEEATQDAFIRAYNALDKFEGTAKFSTWFYRIIYNVCLTKLGQRKEQFESIDYNEETTYGAAESWSNVFEHTEFEMKDLLTFVKNAIEKLPIKYETILSLFYLQDLSYQEICEVTQLPLGTVKVHLFRARALLHERLGKEFQQENIVV